MIIWSGVVLVLIMLCVPGILGAGFHSMIRMKSTIKVDYVFGWIIMLALFEMITVPLTFAGRSLT